MSKHHKIQKIKTVMSAGSWPALLRCCGLHGVRRSRPLPGPWTHLPLGSRGPSPRGSPPWTSPRASSCPSPGRHAWASASLAVLRPHPCPKSRGLWVRGSAPVVSVTADRPSVPSSARAKAQAHPHLQLCHPPCPHPPKPTHGPVCSLFPVSPGFQQGLPTRLPPQPRACPPADLPKAIFLERPLKPHALSQL